MRECSAHASCIVLCSAVEAAGHNRWVEVQLQGGNGQVCRVGAQGGNGQLQQSWEDKTLPRSQLQHFVQPVGHCLTTRIIMHRNASQSTNYRGSQGEKSSQKIPWIFLLYRGEGGSS